MNPFRKHQLFLKWVLINVVFLMGLATGVVAYADKVEPTGQIASAIVIVIYLIASGYAGYLAWKHESYWAPSRERLKGPGLRHVSLAIELSPMIAMLGTVGGFMIAFGSSAGDVQHRVIGASTGLASTFVGIACTVVLMAIRHLVEEG